MLRKLLTGMALGLVFGLLTPASVLARNKVPEVIGTGDTKHCLKTHQIQSTLVVDDRTILFFTKGREVFRNVMKHGCPNLDFYQAFIYKVRNSEVCDTDYIEVFQGHIGIGGPTCGLGEFERVEIVKPQGRAAAR